MKPGIDLISVKNISYVTCCGGSCSANNEADQPSDTNKENNDCDGKLCNPFQTCGCCLLILNAQEIQEVNVKESNFKKQFFSHYSGFNSQFTPDFWQPPKIV